MKLLPLALLSAVLLAGCDQSNDSTVPAAGALPTPQVQPASLPVPEGWQQWVASHTSAWVPASSTWTVRFQRPVVTAQQLGQSQPALVTVTPALAVEASFISDTELRIRPLTPLAADTRYRVSLHPQALALEGVTEPFAFELVALPQQLDVKLEPLAPEGDQYRLAGRVTLVDSRSEEAVKQVVSVQLEGQPLTLTWQQDDPRNFSFSTLVPSAPQARALVVDWAGRTVGVDQRGQHSITVPAQQSFQVTDVRVGTQSEPQLVVSFSRRLDPRANRAGLVRINDNEVRSQVDGHQLRVFPPEFASGQVTLRLEPGLRSEDGSRLDKRLEQGVTLVSLAPAVRFVGTGVVLPQHERLTVPFEAVNLRAVTVTATQVFRNNLGQFLQQNNLDGEVWLENVGRVLWRRDITLDELPQDRWQRYLLDVSELVQQQPGALYRLTLSIDRDQVLLACAGDGPVNDPQRPLGNWDGPQGSETSGWDGIDYWYQNNGYVAYSERHDPCSPAYYLYGTGSNKPGRNLLASDLGLLAKQGRDEVMHLATTTLSSGSPRAGVKVEVFNFQHQRIGQGTSDSDGLLGLTLDGTPFYAIASDGNQRGYLRLARTSALSTSQFDVGGETLDQAVKGMLYGERDVWRPGDDIFLTLVLEDRHRSLPSDHPATLELYDPRGNKVQTRTQSQPVGPFYTFTLRTEEDAPTGTWRVRAQVGGLSFTRTLRVETVVPNRLSVSLGDGDEVFSVAQMPQLITLASQWLSGAPAAGFRADVNAQLLAQPTRFPTHSDFLFDDPVRRFRAEPVTVFEGQLDQDGAVRFPLQLPAEPNAPGMLRAMLTTRVFEPGGQFSIDTQARDYHPWPVYVGLRRPAGDAARDMLLTDTDHRIDILTLDTDGKPLARKAVEVSLFKIDWRWWWDQGGEDLARYAQGAGHTALARATIATDEHGKGEWTLRRDYPEWGRYLLRACDTEGGHCTGTILFMDWPGWAGRANENRGDGASRLTLYTDQERYQVGDTATVRLPQAQRGRALVSIENGSRVLSNYWLELGPDQTEFQLPVTAAMAPNVYVSVTLLQPHQQLDNDRPLRLFGIVPLQVDNPDTRLQPQLKVADEVRPQQPFTITVAEQQGRAMAYTLAVVDEGLLGLTGFKTPDLHARFYRREALGVRTWDLFDQVVGAYAGQLERLIALGGSDALGEMDAEAERRRRFPPVVKFLGAFTLEPGASREHQVTLPAYMGAVRVMVVAADDGRYGRADQKVVVREPLAVLSTLPRVLGPGETLSVPVSVFLQDASVSEVDVSLSSDSALFDVTQPQQTLSFARPGEALAQLRLSVNQGLGQGTLCVDARGGPLTTRETTHLMVRSPNAPSVVTWHARLAPGERWQQQLALHGMDGTNMAELELSSLPPVNLAERLGYLISYPHGCVEQVTSTAFPQLYLSGLMPLSEAQRDETAANVQRAIDRLGSYQLSDGGFSYWPGGHQAEDWSSSYVGHFLVAAQQRGFNVSTTLLNNWRDYQQQRARSFVVGDSEALHAQAYRLFTLALAGAADTGAMNRLREARGLTGMARWHLAAAYLTQGLKDAARELVQNADLTPADYQRPGATFGSPLRDQAVMLPVLMGLGRYRDADQLADRVADGLSADQWHSTQTLAWSLYAMAAYYHTQDAAPLRAQWQQGDQPAQTLTSDAALVRQPLAARAGPVTVENRSEGRLYVVLSNRGTPAAGHEPVLAEGLQLKVAFEGRDGQPLNVATLAQGTDVLARVTVTNLTQRRQDQVALSQLLPSGWQVNPEQRTDAELSEELDYQDIRDDRVYSYFSLEPGASRRFTVSLNASFAGRFYLPGWQVENMYDGKVRGTTAGRWVTVEAR